MAAENAEKQAALMRVLEEEIEHHEKAMEAIAGDHGKKVDVVQ